MDINEFFHNFLYVKQDIRPQLPDDPNLWARRFCDLCALRQNAEPQELFNIAKEFEQLYRNRGNRAFLWESAQTYALIDHGFARQIYQFIVSNLCQEHEIRHLIHHPLQETHFNDGLRLSSRFHKIKAPSPLLGEAESQIPAKQEAIMLDLLNDKWAKNHQKF